MREKEEGKKGESWLLYPSLLLPTIPPTAAVSSPCRRRLLQTFSSPTSTRATLTPEDPGQHRFDKAGITHLESSLSIIMPPKKDGKEKQVQVKGDEGELTPI